MLTKIWQIFDLLDVALAILPLNVFDEDGEGILQWEFCQHLLSINAPDDEPQPVGPLGKPEPLDDEPELIDAKHPSPFFFTTVH